MPGAPSTPRPAAPRAIVATLLALTVTTGVVDAVCYLGLGRVFTANMTGNVVLLGFGLAGTDGLPVLAPLVSLGAFALGAGVGGALIRRHGAPRLHVALVCEAALATAATIVCAAVHIRGGTVVAGVVIALLASAMGLRNAIVRKLAVPELTTTVLTMTITGLAADGAAAARSHVRRLTALVAMIAGAFVGALLVRHTLWVPLALVAATALALTRAAATSSSR
ncbi:MAG TPA: YoaK family protein [Baekduia sp.]|uniref:YoaK family protein n=1 Tax=Baekduia sp. TaxID=2600305 RepID=UPI002D77E91A|nr:YoaK family protein [Baekduia sp.]HET6506840.1 YoaK family protein [Baekduia sp.]